MVGHTYFKGLSWIWSIATPVASLEPLYRRYYTRIIGFKTAVFNSFKVIN